MSAETVKAETVSTRTAIFKRQTARRLVLAVGTTLALTLFYVVFGDPRRELRSADADSFSRSAIGYRALVEFLGSEVPVFVSRSHSADKASATAPLVLLEPPPGPRLDAVLATVRTRGLPAVVVLPKWRGEESAERPGWVERVTLLDPEVPRRVLAAVLGRDELPDGALRRVAPARGDADLPAPQVVAPELLGMVVAHPGGVVAGPVPGTSLWVIADPDLLNTAGLARGRNAGLAHRVLITEQGATSLVIDEVLHGYDRPRTLLAAVLGFPLIAVTLHLVTFFVLVLWATVGRFGSPAEPPARLPPGKRTLLENTARLTAVAERGRTAVERYLDLVVRQAVARLGLARGTATLERLSAVGRRRGAREDLGHLAWRIRQLPEGDADPRRVLELARALHVWRKETHDGPRRSRLPGS